MLLLVISGRNAVISGCVLQQKQTTNNTHICSSIVHHTTSARCHHEHHHHTWGIWLSFCNQRHSTAMRKRMRPYSLKMLRNGATLPAYRLMCVHEWWVCVHTANKPKQQTGGKTYPSSGVMAVSSVNGKVVDVGVDPFLCCGCKCTLQLPTLP